MKTEAFRHLVTIQSPAAGQDALGQPLTGWTDFATVRADIRHQNGLEAVKAGAETSAVKASVRVRYRTDLTAAMRVVHGATVYQVKAVLPDLAGREYVDLLCEVAA